MDNDGTRMASFAISDLPITMERQEFCFFIGNSRHKFNYFLNLFVSPLTSQWEFLSYFFSLVDIRKRKVANHREGIEVIGRLAVTSLESAAKVSQLKCVHKLCNGKKPKKICL